jgi:hypothetical protein
MHDFLAFHSLAFATSYTEEGTQGSIQPKAFANRLRIGSFLVDLILPGAISP